MAIPRTCNSCCACDCQEGTLPFTITLTFSDFQPCNVPATNGEIGLQFASCFGSGVIGGGIAGETEGPLVGTYLHERGDGYAVIGRSEPELAASATGGSGSALSVTLGSDTDGHLDYWGVASIAVDAAGSGYADGTPVAISHSVSDGVASPASAVLRATPTQPTLTVTAAGGSGAVFSVNLTPVAWGVASVSGTASGVNYHDPITFAAGAGVTTTTAASGVFVTTLEEPTATLAGVAAVFVEDAYPDGQPYWRVTGLDEGATAWILSTLEFSVSAGYTDGNVKVFATDTAEPSEEPSGFVPGAITATHICDGGHSWNDTQSVSGYVVTMAGEYSTTSDQTIEPTVTVSGHAGCEVTLTPVAWGVASVTVADGGSGYTNGAALVIAASAGDTAAAMCEATIATNGSGAITGVTVNQRGRYYRLGGIDSVVVLDGGHYYRDDQDAAPYVSSVFVHAVQNAYPLYSYWSARSAVTATVDSDLTSATWGQITALSASGGSGYVSEDTDPQYEVFSCGDGLDSNGLSLVAIALNARPLVKYRIESCFGSGATADAVGEFSSIPRTHASPLALQAWGGGGAGGTVSVTIAESSDENGPYWYVSGVSASGGDSYDGTIGLASAGEFSCVHWEVSPDITLNVDGNGTLTGGTINDGGKFWRNKPYDGGPTPLITTPVVTSGGSGYAIYGRAAPEVEITAATGSGCTFTPTWTEDTDACGRTFFTLASIAVSGGTDYEDGPLAIAAVGGTLTTLDSTPAATLSTSSGVPSSVTVTAAGKGWRDDSSLPPIVSGATVIIEQEVGSAGSGAVVTAQIDTDTGNATPPYGTFGTITGLTVTDQGDGYTLLGGPRPVTIDGVSGCVYAGGISRTAFDVGNYAQNGVDSGADAFQCPIYVWFRGLGEKLFISRRVYESAYPWATLGGWLSTTPLTTCDFESLTCLPTITNTGAIGVARGGSFDQCEAGQVVGDCLAPRYGSCDQFTLSGLKVSASATAHVVGCVTDPYGGSCCPTVDVAVDGLHNRPGGVMRKKQTIGGYEFEVGVTVACTGSGNNRKIRSYAWVQSYGCGLLGLGVYRVAAPIVHEIGADGLPTAGSGDEVVNNIRLEWSVSFADQW